MEAVKQEQAPLHTRFYYGWIIVAIAGLGLFFSGPGQTYSISVFIDYYIREFGWSHSLVSGIYSGATLLSGSLLFIVGRCVDRFGPRTMAITVALLLAFACFWNSFLSNTIMLFIGFFMLRIFGQGSMTLVPKTLVPQWFIEKRGKALSLMTLGTFISSAAFPPLNAWMINTWGWPVAWRIWGVLLCIIFVPLAFFFIRNKPEEIGLKPDGANITQKSQGDVTQEDEHGVPKEVDWTFEEAKRTRQFWLILIAVAIPSLVNTGLVFHLVPIFSENGLSTTTAAFVLSIMAIVGFPVTLVAGYILDRWKVHVVLGLSFIGQFIVLLVAQFTTSVAVAIAFGLLWGIVNGFERIVMNIVWPNYFGRKALGSIKGIAMTAVVIGSAFGPLPFGIAYDFFGGYSEILYLSFIFPLIGMIASFVSPPPVKK